MYVTGRLIEVPLTLKGLMLHGLLKLKRKFLDRHSSYMYLLIREICAIRSYDTRLGKLDDLYEGINLDF